MKEITPSEEFIPYISSYTGGLITQSSTIRVELTEELPVVELNKEIKGSPFQFSPSIAGKAYFLDNRTLEFVPEPGALRHGELYNGSFALGDFREVPKGLSTFRFSFRVIERDFSLTLYQIDIQENDPYQVNLNGILYLSDIVERSTVEKMLKASGSDGQPLKVELNAAEDSDRYAFSISNIKREEEDSELTLSIDGKPAGINRQQQERVMIPGNRHFALLSAQKINEPERGIEVAFTHPIDASQELTGLVQLDGVTSFTTQVQENKIYLYYDSPSGSSITLKLHPGIRSILRGETLKESSSFVFSADALKPKVELLNTGTIMPDSKQLLLPFRTVALNAVDVRVIRIYESNMLMFLQDNSLSGNDALRRSGRLVYKKRVQLNNERTKNPTGWESSTLDLSHLIKQEPGALYRVEISFRQEYSTYPCGEEYEIKQYADRGEESLVANSTLSAEEEAKWDIPNSYYYSSYDNMDWSLYDWKERDNPCHPSYYMDSEKRVSCNLLASNVGLIVKQNRAGKVWVAATNILTTEPLSQAEVTLYNYQLKEIGKARTDGNGLAELEVKGVPFVAVATHRGEKGYLKVTGLAELSVSRFDVGGKELQQGLKGFIYGERGVWRPGDTLHISFILEDKEQRIPDNHPVSFELYNPRGQYHSKLIQTKGMNGFYSFTVPTRADDPTGLWNGYVKVGGNSFHKSFRVEAIKPNRLKINLAMADNWLEATRKIATATLSAAWLTGATASGLNAKVEMHLATIATPFKEYPKYIFRNPASSFRSETIDIFEGKINETGEATITMELPKGVNAPGLLNANFVTRVFEPGGDASISTSSIPFSPYKTYVGLRLNQEEGKFIETDSQHRFDVVTVNAEGKPVECDELEYKIYKVNWSWWWESNNERFDNYVNNSSIRPVAEGKLKTTNGKASFNFQVDYPEWGRYLIYVKAGKEGHATGGTVFVDWAEWRGRSMKSDPNGITMLAFSLDKERYEAGDMATVILPTAANGRALVSIENGRGVLKREWITVNAGSDTKYSFAVTADMAPNVYIYVTLLQPHGQRHNDLPIRMYGVMPLFVTNKASVLEPVITLPELLRPEKEYTVTISEAKGKAMTYSLAVVDEGLLDLTNFKTPNAWEEFYAREALGVRTWDMFDEVIGSFTGSYGSLFAVGGDEMLKNPDEKANRFRPIVKFLGPFSLEKGKSNQHKITLPMYVGSVRTMVIAGNKGAYGSAEQTTPVRTPLMLLSSLPRVVSNGEEIYLPVNIFAMEASVNRVNVTVETTDNLHVVGDKQQSLTFNTTGDQLVYFKLKAGEATGKATLRIAASGNGHTAKEILEIDLRNPNPTVTRHDSRVVESGKSVEMHYALSGGSHNNRVELEIARLPAMDMTRRLDFLNNYNHSCTEQVASCALPLLFIHQFQELTLQEKEQIKTNVGEAIRQLYGRQLPNGGFAYWPGEATANEWVTSYAGVFLALAKEKGYEVNASVLARWRNFQKQAANNWTMPLLQAPTAHYSEMQQAYRLYSLALIGLPETGAMNRMKEQVRLLQARWSLASAYALIGKGNIGNELLFNASEETASYDGSHLLYGSSMRDQAMILEALVLLGRDRDAFRQAQKLSKQLNNEHYFSTQSTAFALMAMARLAEKTAGTIDMIWQVNDAARSHVLSEMALFRQTIPTPPSSGNIVVENKGKRALYVDLITRTQPLRDTLPEIANHISLQVDYFDRDGKPIDIKRLKQGMDLTAKVTINNRSGTDDYTNLALTHIVPSGWEIYNERMAVSEEKKDGDGEKSDHRYSYRDIRDDRVLTYFDLERSKSKVFTIRLQATYAGSYILPAIQCEAMYDTEVMARSIAGNTVVELP